MICSGHSYIFNLLLGAYKHDIDRNACLENIHKWSNLAKTHINSIACQIKTEHSTRNQIRNQTIRSWF